MAHSINKMHCLIQHITIRKQKITIQLTPHRFLIQETACVKFLYTEKVTKFLEQ